jgi:HK97 family phage prohead protease
MEKRISAPPQLEERGDGKPPVISGYAAVFSQLSQPIFGQFREKIAPGAFRRYLESGGEVVAYWDHDTGKPLGRRSKGTLRVSEDTHGLRAEIDPPLDTTWGRDAVASLRRGDVIGMSFGFRTNKDDWEETDDLPVRTLLDADVFDVSPTADPAYPQTEVALRSLAAHRERVHNTNQKARLRLSE